MIRSSSAALKAWSSSGTPMRSLPSTRLPNTPRAMAPRRPTLSTASATASVVAVSVGA